MRPDRVVHAGREPIVPVRSPARPWLRPLRRHSTGIAAPDPRLWALTLAIIAVDAVWMAASGMAAEPLGFGLAGLAVLVLLLAAACLSTVKSDPPLRGMALASAFLIAFTVPVAVLHFLAAGIGLPFVDPALARIETALGFDWTGHVAFLARHPTLSLWLALAYHSSGPQVGLVVIALSATRRLGRLWTYIRLFAATLLCVIVLAALLPALGPYAHYAPRVVPSEPLETVGALWHLEPVARLRAGTLHTLALGDLRGLATFPSFHVCLALLTAWALAPVPLLGPLAALLNAAVIVATLGSGGHYLPDVLAGGLLAFAALACRARRRGPTADPAARDPAARRIEALDAIETIRAADA